MGEPAEAESAAAASRLSPQTSDETESPASGTQPPRRRRRGLLKLYYGSNEAPDEGKKKSSPLDIDGTDFESDQYLARLRRSLDLGQLMQRENEMSQQIKTLDSDMQTLVYENYNKFISATDTIRKMKTQMEDMELEMSRLSENMDGITGLSSGISDSLAPRRERINKLSNGHSMLKKLQFLFELPARLKQCVDMEKFEQAVYYYSKARKILHAYRNIDSFKGIYDECMLIVGQLKEKLITDAENPQATQRQLVDTFELLVKLGHPQEALCEQLLERAKRQYDTDRAQQDNLEVDEAERGEDALPGEDVAKKAATAQDFVNHGNTVTLCNLAEWIMSYQDVFCPPPLDTGDPTATPAKPNEQQRQALNKLLAFADELLESYFGVVVERVRAEMSDASTTIVSPLAALQGLCLGMDKMHSLLPRANLSGRTRDVVVDCVRHLCRAHSHQLQACFAKQLEDMEEAVCSHKTVLSIESQEIFLQQALEQAQTSLADLQLVRQQDFAKTHAYFEAEFAIRGVQKGVVQSFLRRSISTLRNVVVRDDPVDLGPEEQVPERSAVAESERTTEASPDVLLMVATLSLHLNNQLIKPLMTTATKDFPAVDDSPDSLSEMDEMMRGRLAQEANDLATTAINKYVRVQGTTLAKILVASVQSTDWLTVSEPTDISPSAQELITALARADSDLSTFFADSEEVTASRRKFSATSGRSISSNASSKFMSRIRKIFAERIQVFGTVELNRQSITENLVKIVLKAFSEAVRTATFAKHGMQQLEVDCHYLKREMEDFVATEQNDGVVGSMLAQVEGSISQRCVDPSPLSPEIINLILGNDVQELTSPAMASLSPFPSAASASRA